MCYGLKIQKLKRQYGVSNFKKFTVEEMKFHLKSQTQENIVYWFDHIRNPLPKLKNNLFSL